MTVADEDSDVAPARSSRTHPFKGRSVSVVNDFTLPEQWYLYQKTRELKEAVQAGADLEMFRTRRPESAVYLIFMEDSTRTKESFRNAAEFHGLKVNVFDAKTSSFQKNETVTDTIKMLCGYSIAQSTFVIRSKIEGVCRWLEQAILDYTEQRGFPRSSFINAGDGRHEHPTQEFLDEFSFLEHKGWDATSIHLALVGDLFHGRTVHSKVDGLRLYGTVEVDLIAPAELALPRMYEDRMHAAGFIVRKFASIEEYLAQPKVAEIWYFTRLQLERMGDKVLDKSMDLRRAVSFQREYLGKISPNTKFFHPLPRDARHPTLPFWLDGTEFNGWDRQSQNGYFTRIVLLGMLSGHFGDDFKLGSIPKSITGVSATSPERAVSPSRRPAPSSDSPQQGPGSSVLEHAADFIKEIPLENPVADGRSPAVGLVPISNGIIIDQLAEGQTIENIWALMYMVRSVTGLNLPGGQGINRSPNSQDKMCGLISLPDFDLTQWDRLPLKKLAAMAPGSTLNIIREGKTERKFQLQVPPRIYNFPDISCKNQACVSHRSNMQHEVPPYFLRAPSRDKKMQNSDASTWEFTCKYCESLYGFWQIWDYKYYESLDDLIRI